MGRIDPDIAVWQREGPLFGSFDDPGLPGERLCVETHNVYHQECMIQVGPYFIHQDIARGRYYPPRPEDYAPEARTMGTARTLMLVLGLVLLGLGAGFLLPV